jgi:Ca-activated chloride channel family protein
VKEFAKQVQPAAGKAAENRDRVNERLYERAGAAPVRTEAVPRADQQLQIPGQAKDKKAALDQAREALARRQLKAVQEGKLGVDLSVQTNNLRNQSRLEPTAMRQVNGRNCLEIGGVWIDEGFDAKMKTLTIKAQSDAYFRILEKQPKVKEVFQLGNYVVWVTPSGTALVIDTSTGQEKLTDAEIDQLFKAPK